MSGSHRTRSKVTSPKLTLLSTFSGIGGMDAGLEAAGFAVKLCVERDPMAVETLRANRGQDWPIPGPLDIREIADSLVPNDLGLRRRELSLIAGAPPCQPFSKAGQWAKNGRAGLQDERASYLEDLMAIVGRFLPAAVLLENVQGFVQGATSALPFIERRLLEIEGSTGVRYFPWVTVRDTADFGVPQRRVRALVVLLRGDRDFRWPEREFADEPVTAWDALADLSVAGDEPSVGGKWAGLLPSIPEGKNYLWHTNRGGGLPIFGYRTRYWSFLLKLAKDRPSWTLPAHPGPSTGPFHWESRPLTVQEMLRLQTFDAGWEVTGTYRDQVRQVGNATPPLLAEIVGRRLADMLGSHSPGKLGPLQFGIARKDAPPRPERRRPVPQRFRELAGDHPDHPGSGRGPAPRVTT